MAKFPHYLQPDAMDCGPTCLRIVAKHFGRHYNLETLRELTWKTREGVSLLTISDAAEKIGFRTLAIKIHFDDLSLFKMNINYRVTSCVALPSYICKVKF